MNKHDEPQNRNLLLYLLVAFVWTWIFWLSLFVLQIPLEDPSAMLISFIGGFGPFIAAVSVTYFTEGKDAVRTLAKKGINYRFKKIWFIPIFLFFPTVYGLVSLVGVMTGFTLDLVWLSNPLILVPAFLLYFVVSGIQEEFGWRGYALEKLQRNYSAAISSFILGFIWWLWHIPLFFVGYYGDLPVWLFLIQIVIYAILFTWIYNNTNRSVFATMIFHAMANLTVASIFPVSQFGLSLPMFFGLILMVLVTLFIVVIWGPRTLAR
jgi:membrane protease YdiL (CAAX protease family)